MGRRKTLDEVKATAEENHPGITSLLGTRTDSKVAEYYELSIQRVQSLRSQLKIPSFSKRTYSSKPGPQSLDQEEAIFLLEKRHPGILLKLGVVPDNQIASHYGISPQRVFQIRKSLSIPRVSRNLSSL